jgi:hypothetical protein
MPKRGSAGLGLIARLIVFLTVTYFAIDFLLLRSFDEGELVLIDRGTIRSQFRTPPFGREEHQLELFGLTLASIRTDRQEIGWDVSPRGRPVLWIKDGKEFSPTDGTSVLPRAGTNYIDYFVVPPSKPAEWRFRVDHKVARRFQLGPFRFKSGAKYVSYWSPVMTNTLADEAAVPIAANNPSN